MRVLAGKLFLAALLGGAVAASLALPRIFDSAQRPLAAHLPAPRAAAARSVRLPSFRFESAATPQPLRLTPVLPVQPAVGVAQLAPAPAAAPALFVRQMPLPTDPPQTVYAPTPA